MSEKCVINKKKSYENGLFKDIGKNVIEVDRKNLKWERIWFLVGNDEHDINAEPTFHKMRQHEWEQLESKGYGLKKCLIYHDNEYIDKIITEGVHPNTNPETNEFCFTQEKNERVLLTPQNLNKIAECIQSINMMYWYDIEWERINGDIILPIDEIINNSEDHVLTLK